MKTREEILAMTDAEREAYSREWLAAEHANIAEQFSSEVAEVESRKGELPRRDLTELRQLREQIEQARADRTTAKETLVALRTTEQAKRAAAQAELDAAISKPAKDTARAKIDECNAKLEQARIDLETADQSLEWLRQQREEMLFQKRLTQGKLTADDEPRVRTEKASEASNVAVQKSFLAKLKKPE